MDQENYSLQIEGNSNPQNELGKAISYLFSNDYIYGHSSFRQMIEDDRKGYVSIDQLLKNEWIHKYFEQINIDELEHQRIFIAATIQIYCTQLHCKHNRVRRIFPWKSNNMNNIKVIGIECKSQNLSISDIRQQLDSHCFITKQSIRSNKQFMLLHSPQHIEISDSQPTPLKLISYSQLCKEKARRARVWELDEHLKYRPLEYYPRYQNIQRLSLSSEQQEISCVCSQKQMDMDSFMKIAKSPNLTLNQLLADYMHNNKR